MGKSIYYGGVVVVVVVVVIFVVVVRMCWTRTPYLNGSILCALHNYNHFY